MFNNWCQNNWTSICKEKKKNKTERKKERQIEGDESKDKPYTFHKN